MEEISKGRNTRIKTGIKRAKKNSNRVKEEREREWKKEK